MRHAYRRSMIQLGWIPSLSSPTCFVGPMLYNVIVTFCFRHSFPLRHAFSHFSPSSYLLALHSHCEDKLFGIWVRYHSGPKYNDNFDINTESKRLLCFDTEWYWFCTYGKPLYSSRIHTAHWQLLRLLGCFECDLVVFLFCFVLFFFCLTKYDLFVSLGSESLFLLVPCVSVCFFSSVFVTPVASPLLGGGTRPRGVSTLRQAWGILCSPLWPSLAVGNFFGGFVSLASIFSFLLLRIFVFSLFLFLAFVFRLFSVAV